jgi:hypothetical protein
VHQRADEGRRRRWRTEGDVPDGLTSLERSRRALDKGTKVTQLKATTEEHTSVEIHGVTAHSASFNPECEQDTAQGPAEIRKEVHQKVRASQECDCAAQARNNVLNPHGRYFSSSTPRSLLKSPKVSPWWLQVNARASRMGVCG